LSGEVETILHREDALGLPEQDTAPSQVLIPFLRPVLEGADAWESDETLSRAVEIQDGRIRNTTILDFHHRNQDHPYAVG
jgi:hypothetical protein